MWSACFKVNVLYEENATLLFVEPESINALWSRINALNKKKKKKIHQTKTNWKPTKPSKTDLLTGGFVEPGAIIGIVGGGLQVWSQKDSVPVPRREGQGHGGIMWDRGKMRVLCSGSALRGVWTRRVSGKWKVLLSGRACGWLNGRESIVSCIPGGY